MLSPALRIVSLLPSATEIACALGATEELVGISHECDFPTEITHLPKLTSSLIDSHATSGDIHREVALRARQGLSLYEVDFARLGELKPDVILTQDQCQVCAVSLEDVREAVSKATMAETNICSLRPNHLKEVAESFLAVGAAINRFPQAVRLVKSFWEGLRALTPPEGWRPPRVVCLEWLDPFMVAGHWTPELIRLAGGEPLIVSEPGPFKTVTADEILTARPDVVMVMPCGFPLKRVQTEVEKLSSDFWRRLDEVTEGKIFLVDGNQFFNRSGPRLVESAEIVSGILRRDSFLCFKHLAHFKLWRPQRID